MELDKLLEIFSNPNEIHALNYMDKLLGVAITMIIGMGITLCALIIILYVLQWMPKILSSINKEKDSNNDLKEKLDEEVVVAITAAITNLYYDKNNFSIKSIKKIK